MSRIQLIGCNFIYNVSQRRAWISSKYVRSRRSYFINGTTVVLKRLIQVDSDVVFEEDLPYEAGSRVDVKSNFLKS